MPKYSKGTTVSFILDSSGSMGSVHKDTVDGFNDYINELKTDSSETILRLQTFNSNHFDVSFEFNNIIKIPKMQYENFSPEGMTPLLDSVGRAINETSKFIEENDRDNSQVIFTVMTDGLENSSTEFSIGHIKEMISEKEKLGWQFTYLGANHDVWSVAKRFGLKNENIHRYSASNPKEAFMYSARHTLNLKQKISQQRRER